MSHHLSMKIRSAQSIVRSFQHSRCSGVHFDTGPHFCCTNAFLVLCEYWGSLCWISECRMKLSWKHEYSIRYARKICETSPVGHTLPTPGLAKLKPFLCLIYPIEHIQQLLAFIPTYILYESVGSCTLSTCWLWIIRLRRSALIRHLGKNEAGHSRYFHPTNP